MSEKDYCKFKGHAPGPWYYRKEKHADWGEVNYLRPDGDYGHICRTNVHSKGYISKETLDKHRRNKTDPIESTARLIAAAPALLERCLVLESVVDNMKGGLTPQTVALAKALERGRVADREIDALSDEALHLRVKNEMQRREIEAIRNNAAYTAGLLCEANKAKRPGA